MTRDDGGVRFASETAEELLGYGPGELTRLSPAALADCNHHVVDAHLTRRDGSQLPVRIAGSTTDLDGQPATVRFFFDTTEQGLADEELRASERRFRALIEAAPDAIAVTTADGLVYVNPALLRMLGEPDTAELDSTALVASIHPESLPVVASRLQRLLCESAGLPPYDLRVRHRAGHYFQVEVVDMQTEWDGSPAVLSFARDLSERKQFQAELIQADRLAAVGTLAAGVAHEINNPLAYVLLNLEYLIRELDRAAFDDAHIDALLPRLAEARHGAERVGAIVRDLRTFSRADRDSTGPVDVERVLSSAVRVAGAQLTQRARVVTEYANVPPVRADGPRLEQVFLNLLINAAQALPDGRAEDNEVRISARRLEPSHVVVEIADTGAGIAPELLDRVFDPFFTTKPVGIGTGLGLPICHSIVTAFGGEITAKSRVGEGTTFRIVLPMDRSGVVAEKASKPAPPAAPAPAPGARVLVVDDELPVATMLSRILGDEHEVRISTSAREALDLVVSGEPFDVVLCDLLMPGMSGMDLHEQLAARRPGYERRLVFMTGGAFTPRASEFLATVPNQRVEKPFDLNEVRRLVRELARATRDAS